MSCVDSPAAIVIGSVVRHRVHAVRATHAIVIDSPARHELPGSRR